MTVRIQAIGIMMWIFYIKGEYEAIDTAMAVLGTWVTAVDVWVCIRENVKGKAVFRGIAGGVIGMWGLMGMTAVCYALYTLFNLSMLLTCLAQG